MSFKKLILIRHGDYKEDTLRLSSRGEQQMRNLIEGIKEHLDGEANVLFLSSSAPRAEDSAIVLSKGLNIPYEAVEELWSDNRHWPDNEEAFSLIETKQKEKGDADVVILVTHLEYSESLPQFIINNAGKKFRAPQNLNKGDMLYVDLVKESISHTRA